MGKYFGTDGFRGEANCTLTADHAYKVGRFLGWYYTQLKRRSGSDERKDFEFFLNSDKFLKKQWISCTKSGRIERIQMRMVNYGRL